MRVGNMNFDVRFRHVNQAINRDRIAVKNKEVPGFGTQCRILDSNGNEVAEAFAILYWQDRFNKTVGRTESFKKAIEVAKANLRGNQIGDIVSGVKAKNLVNV